MTSDTCDVEIYGYRWEELKAERDALTAEVEKLLKHAENARGAMLFKVKAECEAALGEGYELIRTMGGRRPCDECSGTGTRVYVADSLVKCKTCKGLGYTGNASVPSA